MRTINELSNEELEKVLKEAQEELEKRKTEWQQDGDKYWVIDMDNLVEERIWENTGLDLKMEQIGNMFKTEKDAKNAKKLLNLELQYKIARWIVENDKEALKLDWEDGSVSKWWIYYYSPDKTFEIDCNWDVKNNGTLYFSSEDKVKQCIKDLGLNDGE